MCGKNATNMHGFTFELWLHTAARLSTYDYLTDDVISQLSYVLTTHSNNLSEFFQKLSNISHGIILFWEITDEIIEWNVKTTIESSTLTKFNSFWDDNFYWQLEWTTLFPKNF